MRGLFPSLRYAFRSLRRSPGFTIATVATLALGIAASSLMYCVLRSTLLRALPFADPDRLVALWEHHPLLGKQEVAAPDFHDWRDRNRTFEQMAAYTTASYFEPILGACGTRSEKVGATLATRNLFPLLGVRPALGRSFVESEDEGGHDNVAIVSDRLWRRCFHGDPATVGLSIRLNGEAYTGSSAAPQSLIATIRHEALSVDPKQVVSDPVTMDDVIQHSLQYQRFSMQLFSLLSTPALALAAVGTYGVILNQTQRRVPELAIRIGLGASRVSIYRAVVGPGMSVVLAGVAAGSGIALVLTRLLRGMLFGVPLLDFATYAAAAGLVTIIGLAAMLVPARRAGRIDASDALRARD